MQRILFYTFQELPLFYGISLISSPSYTKDDGGLRADQKWNTTIGVLTKIHCWTRTDICLLCGILPCDFWQLSLACVCAKNERSVITRFVIHILPSSNPNGTDTQKIEDRKAFIVIVFIQRNFECFSCWCDEGQHITQQQHIT